VIGILKPQLSRTMALPGPIRNMASIVITIVMRMQLDMIAKIFVSITHTMRLPIGPPLQR